MIVQFEKMKQIDKNGKDFWQITCKKADGEVYNKDFPTWTEEGQDLADNFDDIGKGEYIELKYHQNKWKNLKSVRVLSPDEVDAYKNKDKEGGKPENKGGGTKKWANVDTRRSDGTSRGDDTNRSASIYLAKDIVLAAFESRSAADKKKVSAGDLLADTMVMADVIFTYITKGVRHNMNMNIDDAGDDLDPPIVGSPASTLDESPNGDELDPPEVD